MASHYHQKLGKGACTHADSNSDLDSWRVDHSSVLGAYGPTMTCTFGLRRTAVSILAKVILHQLIDPAFRPRCFAFQKGGDRTATYTCRDLSPKPLHSILEQWCYASYARKRQSHEATH